MLNPLGTLLLLGVDSACASAAIRLLLPREKLKWRLPAAFAFCDGLGALLGSVVPQAYHPGERISLAILGTSLAAVTGLLLAITERPVWSQSARVCKVVTLFAIPVLLAADNFLAGKGSYGDLPVAALGAGAAATSCLMSVLGLAIGEFVGVRFERLGRLALLSTALLLLAAAAA
jgi:hypothetical protein